MASPSEVVWYTGPVADAVKLVTEKNLVFLVYIYDDSKESKLLDTIFQNEELLSVMKQKCIALKMQKDSDNANLFQQRYPTYQVPVVYFILQGTIKDFGIQDLTGQDIINKLEAICPKSANEDAKAKLEAMRKKQAEEEKKQAREREIKRREDGKLAQETRSSLQEQQNRIYLEKKKKEKQEENEYKRKVKEQIARDRADQIAARKAEKQKRESLLQPDSNNHQKSSTYYDHSNLNIKQLDGSNLRHNFSSSDTLASVSQWIDASRTDGDMPFKLFAQFPNRNFDIGDEQRTLLELKLCPSGTLIMKPIKNATTAYASSSTHTSNWMSYLYSAGDSIYQSVSQVGTSVASYLVTPTEAPEPGQRLGSSSRQQRSNINTLQNDSKKDDDRQTYNGNSVNQE